MSNLNTGNIIDPSNPDATRSPAWFVARAWERGELLSASMQAEAQKYFDAALANNDGASMNPAHLGHAVNLVEPNVTLPTDAQGASFALYDTLHAVVIDKLGGLFGDFMQTYFPDDSAAWRSAQDWIVKSIEQGGTGIRPSVERQIWERDRARVQEENRRSIDEATLAFSARGFPMPPGAMVGAIRATQKQSHDKIAQFSRDVAIKQADMEIENVRFAVENAITMRRSALDAARDYISAIASSVGQAGQVLPSVTDSQSRLISAVSSFYGARISAEELRLRAAVPNAEFQQAANTKNLEARLQLIRNKLDAAIAAADALSRQAQAMLNGLNVSTSTGAQAHNSVGYNYSGEVTGAGVHPIPII